MELAGKVIAILEPRNGISKTSGNPWVVQGFVIETHEQYPKKMCFEVFGEDRLRQFNIQMDEEINVSFDIDAREYQGRWFNSIRAFRVEHIQPGQELNQVAPAAAPMPSAAQTFGAPAPAQPAPAPAAPAAPAAPVNFDAASDETSDLPF